MSDNNMPVWEQIFTDRYPWTSHEEACRYIVEELNKYSTEQCQLDTEDYENLLDRKLSPGGRYWANIKAPFDKRQLTNCFAFSVEDNRESWAKLLHDSALVTMYGGGLGVDYSKLRPNGGQTSTPKQLAGGPCSLMKALDAMVLQLRSCRRGALLAQLNWDHLDIHEFLELKRGEVELSRTNTSVQYDPRWHDIMDEVIAQGFRVHTASQKQAWEVFKQNVAQAVTFGDPGFLFNGLWKDGIIRNLTNACGELRSDTSHDSCNIGGYFPQNFNIFDHRERLSVARTLVKLLLLGTKGSIVKSPEATEVRRKNNRLLIGPGGLYCWYHENYAHGDLREAALHGFNADLRMFANMYSDILGMERPVDVTGIAPHGTLFLIADVDSGGIEPPFAEATVKKVSKQDGRLGRPKYLVSVNRACKRMRDKGGVLLTAQNISFEQRLEWQAFCQQFSDMGISSTINLPPRGTPGNDMPIEDMAKIIAKYHRRIAGLTCYPSGAIADQPLQPISYEEAMRFVNESGEALVEDNETLVELSNIMCKSGVCGV